MSSRAADADAAPRPADAGFMLLEVLVAVLVAALVLGAVGAALAQGWRNARVPADVLAAATLARSGLQRGPDAAPPRALPAGFALSRGIAEVAILPRPSPVAPPPQAASATAEGGLHGRRGNDVMPGVTRGPVRAATGRLEAVTVTVTTPSGRRVSVETVRLDAPLN